MYQEGINQIWNLGKKTISQNVTCPILINFHDLLHSFSFKAHLLAFSFFLCIFIHSFLIFNPISVLLAFCFQDFLLLHYSYFIPISVYHFPFLFFFQLLPAIHLYTLLPIILFHLIPHPHFPFLSSFSYLLLLYLFESFLSFHSPLLFPTFLSTSIILSK